MADQIELDLIVKALSEGFEKLGGDLEKLGKSTEAPAEPAKKTSLSLTDLKSAIDLTKEAAQKFGQVFKTAFVDIGLAGATAIQTGESFNTMLGVIGAAPNLLDELKQASGGTIPDMQLMSSTSTLLAGAQGDLAVALANSTPRLMEIARAANKLNPSLGDTTFLYNSLAMGIKRASPLILDNLGLTIKLGDANEAMAAQLGKTVEELTAAEKQQAILNATLAAGDVLINQVGGSVESATDPFNRMTAAFENLSNVTKASLAPALADAAEGTVTLLTAFDETTAALSAHNTELIAGSTNYAAYVAEMERAIESAGLILGVNGVRIEKEKILTEEMYNAIRAGAELNDSELKLATARATSAVATTNAATATREWANSSFYAEQAQLAARDATLEAKAAMEAGKEAANNIASAFSGVGLAAYEAEVYTTLLKVATGELSSEDAELILNLADVKQALTSGAITLGEYFAAMLDGQITTEEYSALLGDQKTALDETEAAFLANTQTAKEYQSALNELDGKVVEITVNTTFTSSGGSGEGGAGNGGPVYDQRVGNLPVPTSDPAGAYANDARYQTLTALGMSAKDALELLMAQDAGKGAVGAARSIPRGNVVSAPDTSAMVSTGGENVTYANNVIIYATNAEMGGGGESFALVAQRITA